MTKKYHSKDGFIEAIQFTGENTKDCCQFLGRSNISSCIPNEYIGIYTSDGPKIAKVGEYIIKDTAKTNMFNSCDSTFFEKTYFLLSPN